MQLKQKEASIRTRVPGFSLRVYVLGLLFLQIHADGMSRDFDCTNGIARHSDTTYRLKIVQSPIPYGEERKRLSLEYLEQRHGLVQKHPIIKPRMIILHYTAGGSAKSTIDYFSATRIEQARDYIGGKSPLNVSSQYLVDRDGTVYQLMEDTLFARHAIGLNHCAIGIENVGSEKMPLTPQQVSANAALVMKLAARHRIEYLIGHQEYGRFRKSSLWKETDPAYYTGKSDPGASFMAEVRQRVKHLGLKSNPD
jgi:N-acetylmuramoyl-L-alanine amidase